MTITARLGAASAALRTAVDARLRSFGPGGVQNLAMLGGAVLVSHGVARIYGPAGEIVAGVFALTFAWLLARAAT